MTRGELAQLLRRVGPDLAEMTEPWWLIGSAAIIVAGGDWDSCDDVDVLTTVEGAGRLEALWADLRRADYAPDPGAPFRSRFARYDFRPGAVEVMGGLELRGSGGWRPVVVRDPASAVFDGGRWPVSSLEDQIRILREFGRPKDLAKAARLAGG